MDSGALDSIDDVIDLMESLARAMPADDGVRAFHEMYLTTTRHVQAAIRGQAFADAAFMTRLDVVFASLYLDALDGAGTGPVPRAWRALFEARTRPGVGMLQFAVAGMNAHINLDLPRALVRTVDLLGGGLDAGRRADFEAINRVLAQTQPLVRRELLTGPFALVDRALGEADDRVALWSIERAREFAWSNAQALSVIAGSPLESPFVDGLDRVVALTSALILGV